MKFHHRHLLTIVAAASLAACSSVKLDEAPVESRTPTTAGAGAGSTGSGAAAGGAAASSQTRVAPVDVTGSNAAMNSNLPRVVYFDLDSYIVKDEFRPVIELNAKLLTADRKKQMAVEGHTDERGSSEYNLALGQRRAEAVVKSLTLLGVQNSQLEPVSFGKERPAVQGSDESAWAKNRRAELASR
jgi:peptidoglycan-associated lipoprotein